MTEMIIFEPLAGEYDSAIDDPSRICPYVSRSGRRGRPLSCGNAVMTGASRRQLLASDAGYPRCHGPVKPAQIKIRLECNSTPPNSRALCRMDPRQYEPQPMALTLSMELCRDSLRCTRRVCYGLA
jgi:hypothetical protein